MSHRVNKLTHLAHPHVERAIDHLAAIAENVDQLPGARVAAACALLDLAQGRPIHRPRSGPGGAAPPAVRVTWGKSKT